MAQYIFASYVLAMMLACIANPIHVRRDAAKWVCVLMVAPVSLPLIVAMLTWWSWRR